MLTTNATVRVPLKREAVLHEISETGEVVLIDSRSERILLLNDVGAAVWLLVDGARTATEIAQVIVDTLPADPTQVERDVEAFLGTLAEHGLIESLAP